MDGPKPYPIPREYFGLYFRKRGNNVWKGMERHKRMSITEKLNSGASVKEINNELRLKEVSRILRVING